MWGFGTALRRLGADLGVTQVVVFGCGLLYLLSLALYPAGVSWEPSLNFLSPSGQSLHRLGAAGALPLIIEGHWWTLLSAGWLHGSLIHILFNMMWVRQLAPAASMIFGHSRTMPIYILASAGGFLLSSVMGWLLLSTRGNLLSFVLSWLMGAAGITVGASAAVFGLLGAVVYAGRRGVAAQLGRQAWVWAIFLFVFSLFFRGVDNWAHLGGFVAGYGLARWFNPLTRERPDHLYGALAGLALTVVAVVIAFFSGRG
jgi:rhomboid protease GluP